MKVNKSSRKSENITSALNKSFICKRINSKKINLSQNKIPINKDKYIRIKTPSPIYKKRSISLSQNIKRKTFSLLKHKNNDTFKSLNFEKEMDMIYDNMIENKKKKNTIWKREFLELLKKTKSINFDLPIPKSLNTIGSIFFRNYKFWVLFVEYYSQKLNFENLLKLLKNSLNYLNNNQDINKIKKFFNNYILENNVPLSEISLYCKENNLEIPSFENKNYEYILMNKQNLEKSIIQNNKKNSIQNSNFDLDNTIIEIEKNFQKREEIERKYNELKKNSMLLKEKNKKNDNEYNSIINESSFFLSQKIINEQINQFIKINEEIKKTQTPKLKKEQIQLEGSYEKYLKYMAEKNKKENEISKFNY